MFNKLDTVMKVSSITLAGTNPFCLDVSAFKAVKGNMRRRQTKLKFTYDEAIYIEDKLFRRQFLICF